MRALVVGAGICGAFVATTLRRRFGPEAQLDVLDREPRTGGRALQRRIAGVDVETGASLLHSSNQLVTGTARDLGLTVVVAGRPGDSIGIWDGTRLVFRTTGRPRQDALRLLARYRFALLRARRDVGRLVRQVESVYPRLERGESWEDPAALLGAIGLRDLSQARAVHHFAQGREAFRAEFVDAVSRNNYSQDTGELNALAGLVALAGAGLGGGQLVRVAEGNGAVASKLLLGSGARVVTGAEARLVERSGDSWVVTGSGFDSIMADVVVLAMPLELGDLELSGASADAAARTYRTVHVTFVVGELRPGAFGTTKTPDFVLTTAGAGSLRSVQRIADASAGRLYKIFSAEELSDDAIERLFSSASGVTRMRWSAYPDLAPMRAWPHFRLADGLYYANAMEYAVSTMETQAIAGVATANLVAYDRRTITTPGDAS